MHTCVCWHVCVHVCVCACVLVCACVQTCVCVVLHLTTATNLIPLDQSGEDDYYNIYLEQYLAVASYNAEDTGQLKFPAGAKLSVIDKEEDG